MKYILAFIFTIGWAFDGCGEELSLKRAAGILIERNPVLAQRNLQLEAAQREKDRTRSAYFPQVDLTQGWSRSDNPVFVFGSLLNQRNFTESNFDIRSLNEPEPLSDFSTQIRLGWLLYDFGGRESRMAASDAGIRIAGYARDVTRSALFQELVRRYYGVSLAQEEVQSTRLNLRSAEARAEQAQLRVQQGLAVTTESLSAAVFLSKKKQELIDSENNLVLAKKSLQELLGGSYAEEAFETARLAEKDFNVPEIAWWIQEMKEKRPELRIAEESRRVAAAKVKGSRASFLPSVQAWSGYEWHGESLDYSGNNWGMGVELRWNLFRGFSDKAAYSLEKIREKEAAEQEREVENMLLLQVQSAYYKFQSSLEKLKVAAAIQDQAKENQRIHADRYEAGLISIQDTLQAEAAYGETQLMYWRSLYDVHVTRGQLLGAAGMPERILGEE